METLKFKTNINCGNCIRSLTPFLNELDEVEYWKVDTDNPDKILEVKVETGHSQTVIKAVEEAGFKIEKVS